MCFCKNWRESKGDQLVNVVSKKYIGGKPLEEVYNFCCFDNKEHGGPTCYKKLVRTIEIPDINNKEYIINLRDGVKYDKIGGEDKSI